MLIGAIFKTLEQKENVIFQEYLIQIYGGKGEKVRQEGC